MSEAQKDFLANYLRIQSGRLSELLGSMEADNHVDCGYLDNNLREIEESLRMARKQCICN